MHYSYVGFFFFFWKKRISRNLNINLITRCNAGSPFCLHLMLCFIFVYHFVIQLIISFVYVVFYLIDFPGLFLISVFLGASMEISAQLVCIYCCVWRLRWKVVHVQENKNMWIIDFFWPGLLEARFCTV